MPTNPGSPVLDLEPVDVATQGLAYTERLDLDNTINGNFDAVDAFSGQLTASYSTTFKTSGVMSTLLTSDIGSAYADYNRVIVGVKAWAANSGSGGVTRINVLRQQDGVGGALVSIYSNNAFKCALSGGSAHASYKVFSGGTMSGTLWPAGTVLVVRPETAADLMSDVTVQVNWKPSGTYGSV